MTERIVELLLAELHRLQVESAHFVANGLRDMRRKSWRGPPELESKRELPLRPHSFAV